MKPEGTRLIRNHCNNEFLLATSSVPGSGFMFSISTDLYNKLVLDTIIQFSDVELEALNIHR